ncbi:MAG: phosphoenolpyruvate--protein phosphotransferase [Gemmatimonadetes bacterium]|nr:phosphoenolpyruvate--protein phosphotransferase [Gemmatimonadota bacterium]NNM07176.1 phosphoenolpyruvate--protein phosphotransferase [Gemmatimonadota bacterium]
MVTIRDGFGVSEGIAEGRIQVLNWEVPEVVHRRVEADLVETEVELFQTARDKTRVRLQSLKEATSKRLGDTEARIFDPQLMMLDDPEVIDRTVEYIRGNQLTAAQAFEWRILELRAMWERTSQPMVLDRINDLEDLHARVLRRIMDLPFLFDHTDAEEPVILVAKNLTPSLAVQFDPEKIVGVATDQGTRTSHWVILARSLSLPAVVGLGDITRLAQDGQEAILDGRIGRVVLNPTEREWKIFRGREVQIREWEEEIKEIVKLDADTKDGQPIALRANLDLPWEAAHAKSHGADGIGLYRTEFLMVGRSELPGEEEQYEAYRHVAQTFPESAVMIRTFDVGGDKFPMFLDMPRESNPFLGWRAIRVCLDQPELFRPQLRALLRATAHGDVRIMLPLVNDVDEVLRVRALLKEEEDRLAEDGLAFNPGHKLGLLIETPAAALDAVELARHADFFSIGTNDLVQYTLAVDRNNTRLAHLFNPFHPAVVRQLHQVSRVARAAGIEVSVCGELAANPLGAFLLLGLNIHSLSVAWPSLPEIKKVIRAFRIEDARTAAAKALAAPTSREVVAHLVEGVGDSIDLSAFSGRWSLNVPNSGV